MSHDLLPPNRRTSKKGDREAVSIDTSSAAHEGGRANETRGRKRGRGVRWLQRLQLVVGIVVVLGASVLVAWGLRRYLRTSPRFAVRSAIVEGNHRRGAHQILKRAAVETGQNVFTVDELVAEAAIEADPWIADASVDVELPGTVRIVVTEREARALVSLDGALYIVDAHGEVFKQWDEGDPHDVPVLTGIEAEAIGRDREGVRMRLRRALDLMRDLEEAKVVDKSPIQEIHLAADGALTVTLGADALAFAFGNPPYRAKIAKAQRILSELSHRKVQAAVIFLDNDAHPERVVVRMR